MSEHPIRKIPIHVGSHRLVHRLLIWASALAGIDIRLGSPRVEFVVDLAIFCAFYWVLQKWSVEWLDMLSGAIIGYFVLGSPIFAVILGAPAGFLLGAFIDGFRNPPREEAKKLRV